MWPLGQLIFPLWWYHYNTLPPKSKRLPTIKNYQGTKKGWYTLEVCLEKNQLRQSSKQIRFLITSTSVATLQVNMTWNILDGVIVVVELTFSSIE